MKLGIVNRLVDGLLSEAEDRDYREKVRNQRCMTIHVQDIVDAINNCGIKFHVWEANEGNKGKTFTSVSGGDCERLLKALPEKRAGKLHPQT